MITAIEAAQSAVYLEVSGLPSTAYVSRPSGRLYCILQRFYHRAHFARWGLLPDGIPEQRGYQKGQLVYSIRTEKLSLPYWDKAIQHMRVAIPFSRLEVSIDGQTWEMKPLNDDVFYAAGIGSYSMGSKHSTHLTVALLVALPPVSSPIKCRVPVILEPIELKDWLSESGLSKDEAIRIACQNNRPTYDISLLNPSGEVA